MTIAEQITRAKADYDEVFEAGKQAEYNRFWDSFQRNGTRVSYYNAFAGPGWTIETLKPKYRIAPKETQYADQYCTGLFFHCNRGNPTIDFRTIAHLFDFSQLVNAVNLFGEARMDYITANLPKASSLSGAFAQMWGATHTTITLTVSERCTNYNNCFASSSKLTNLFFTDGSVIAASIDLQSSPLIKESITSVVNALSATATGKTATFKKTAKEAAFTADEWAALIADKTNWTFSLI